MNTKSIFNFLLNTPRRVSKTFNKNLNFIEFTYIHHIEMKMIIKLFMDLLQEEFWKISIKKKFIEFVCTSLDMIERIIKLLIDLEGTLWYTKKTFRKKYQ